MGEENWFCFLFCGEEEGVLNLCYQAEEKPLELQTKGFGEGGY